MTCCVRPQFCTVVDNLFYTDYSLEGKDMLVDAICNQFCESNQDIYAEDELSMDGESIYFPHPLDEV